MPSFTALAVLFPDCKKLTYVKQQNVALPLTEIQHLTGHKITTLAQKLQSFCRTGGFFKLEWHFLVIFALKSKSQSFDKGWKFQS